MSDNRRVRPHISEIIITSNAGRWAPNPNSIDCLLLSLDVTVDANANVDVDVDEDAVGGCLHNRIMANISKCEMCGEC